MPRSFNKGVVNEEAVQTPWIQHSDVSDTDDDEQSWSLSEPPIMENITTETKAAFLQEWNNFYQAFSNHQHIKQPHLCLNPPTSALLMMMLLHHQEPRHQQTLMPMKMSSLSWLLTQQSQRRPTQQSPLPIPSCGTPLTMSLFNPLPIEQWLKCMDLPTWMLSMMMKTPPRYTAITNPAMQNPFPNQIFPTPLTELEDAICHRDRTTSKALYDDASFKPPAPYLRPKKQTQAIPKTLAIWCTGPKEPVPIIQCELDELQIELTQLLLCACIKTDANEWDTNNHNYYVQNNNSQDIDDCNNNKHNKADQKSDGQRPKWTNQWLSPCQNKQCCMWKCQKQQHWTILEPITPDKA